VRCHGPGGINLRPGIPDLGGQKTAYLVKQLHALNATARSAACDEAANLRCDPVMSGHAVRLTVDQMSSLAEYFSEFGCRTVR
jgi:cytochrome c553